MQTLVARPPARPGALREQDAPSAPFDVDEAPEPRAEPAACAVEDERDDDAPVRRRGWFRDVFGIALVAMLFYTLSFHVSVVRGSSMSPGIHDGDRILVEPWSYVFGGVSRGDVVVLQSPVDPGLDYIKRVIGLPGDEILIAAGAVWVNGDLLEEPYAVPGDTSVYQWTRVLDDHYFVLGDNRPHSSDSRDFGLVPARFLRGRVDLRVWPLPRAGLVD